MVLTHRLSPIMKILQSPDTANSVAMCPARVRRNFRDFFLIVCFREGNTRGNTRRTLFFGVFFMAIFRAELNVDKDFPQLGHMTGLPFL